MAKIPEDVMKAAREALRVQTRMRDWPGQGDRLSEIDRGEWDKGFACRAAAQAILAERERCIDQMISMSDAASRIIAMGWRGNPHMSGDDRDFMGPMQRQRHDGRVAEALGEIAAAIRGGSNA